MVEAAETDAVLWTLGRKRKLSSAPFAIGSASQTGDPRLESWWRLLCSLPFFSLPAFLSLLALIMLFCSLNIFYTSFTLIYLLHMHYYDNYSISRAWREAWSGQALGLPISAHLKQRPSAFFPHGHLNVLVTFLLLRLLRISSSGECRPTFNTETGNP